MSRKLDRRALFGLSAGGRPRVELDSPRARGAVPAAPFSLERFYGEREDARRQRGSESRDAIPRFELRAELPEVETTRVGTPELAGPSAPKELAPVQAAAFVGRLRVMPEHCLAWQGSPCTVCSERCPEPGALVLHESRPTVDERACTNCGVCIQVCPAPVNAFEVLAAASGEPRS